MIMAKNLLKSMGVLLLVFPFFFSCSEEQDAHSNSNRIDLEITRELTINSKYDQISEILGGLQVSDDTGIAFGVDLRIQRAYSVNLESGDVRYLANRGKGPKELDDPVQLTMISSNELIVYDNALDQFAHIKDGEIIKKYQGTSDHNIWIRNYFGFYLDETLISAIEDPEYTRSRNYTEAKPLSLLDLQNDELKKAGRFSPTVKVMDSNGKYPVIYLDKKEELVYYVYLHDHNVMVYDLSTDDSGSVGSYIHSMFRERDSSARNNQPGNLQAAKALGTSHSTVIGIEEVEDRLIIIWQNFNNGFYDNQGDYSSGNVDFFGVSYDLPGFSNPKEFTLNGRFFGVYKNQLIVEEQYGTPEIQLGFYEFVD
jgi:hypothetical protein